MFSWFHEASIEVDVPLQVAWDFCMNPSNWPKWEDRFDACAFEGTPKTGSKVKMKIKGKSVYLPVFFTEVKPYQECKLLVRVLFFTQQSSSMFQEISPEKVRITMHLHISSLFAPFMKSFFLRKLEKSNSKLIDALKEFSSPS
jgi:hypothetical protein